MNLDEVEYSTKPQELHDFILRQRVLNHDFEAMLTYITKRTNLSEEEALKLDAEDLGAILVKIEEANEKSLILQKLME